MNRWHTGERLCGFNLWSCQLWLYLLLSCEIGRVIWILSCSTVWRVYRFWGYSFHWFRSLSMYFPIDYYRFRNYRIIAAVFVSDNIVSISFSRKKYEIESDLVSYQSFPIVFIPRNSTIFPSYFFLVDHQPFMNWGFKVGCLFPLLERNPWSFA
jgi:hypothetical protein